MNLPVPYIMLYLTWLAWFLSGFSARGSTGE